MSAQTPKTRPGSLTGDDWREVAGWLLDEDADEGVTRVLGLLGSRHRADRAWVIRYDDAFTLFWNTHEWVAPDITPQLGEVQGIPVDVGLWIHEGLHRDGVDYVLVLLVTRRNIVSGVTSIHALDGSELGHFTLTDPFDAALVDDRRVAHGVTAVVPIDPTVPAYRDVLVVTFVSASGSGRPAVSQTSEA